MSRRAVVCLVALACVSSGAPAQSPPPVVAKRTEAPAAFTAISPIFSQLVMLSYPAGFTVVNEKAMGDRYIREAVPAGQGLGGWSEMITVTGAKGLAANPNATPQRFVEQIASGFKQACPETFSLKGYGASKIGDHDAFVGWIGCGAVTAAGASRSESTLILAIKGSADIYTIQWAERGPAEAKPLDADDTKWLGRLQRLGPLKVCPVVPGESAPYPSCINR